MGVVDCGRRLEESVANHGGRRLEVGIAARTWRSGLGHWNIPPLLTSGEGGLMGVAGRRSRRARKAWLWCRHGEVSGILQRDM